MRKSGGVGKGVMGSLLVEVDPCMCGTREGEKEEVEMWRAEWSRELGEIRCHFACVGRWKYEKQVGYEGQGSIGEAGEGHLGCLVAVGCRVYAPRSEKQEYERKETRGGGVRGSIEEGDLRCLAAGMLRSVCSEIRKMRVKMTERKQMRKYRRRRSQPMNSWYEDDDGKEG